MSLNEISKLIEISQFYGKNNEYVIAGGGNTSYKDGEHIWVKASGTSLFDIQEDGFVCLHRGGLKQISEKEYSKNSAEREAQVKADLAKAIVSPKHLRPSVETSMHEIIDYSYVVHTHPNFVNALMCATNAMEMCIEIFPEDSIYIEYTDPGYILFKSVFEKLQEYREIYAKVPHLIFLQNHGIFVAANSVEEIKELYAQIEEKLKERIQNDLYSSDLRIISPAIMTIIAEHVKKDSLLAKGFSSDLIQYFVSSPEQFLKISKPFTPDIIVYCKSNYLFLREGISEEEIRASYDAFSEEFGYYPKIILAEKKGLIIVGDTEKNVQTILEVFVDMIKISLFTENFGGQHFMSPAQIDFIDNWEVENYRRNVSNAG